MSSSNTYLSATETTTTVRSVYAIIASNDAGLSAGIHGSYCAWFAVQNKHASEDLFYQTDNTAMSGANVNIPAGEQKTFPPKLNKYDLRDEFIRVNTSTNNFTIEVHWD